MRTRNILKILLKYSSYLLITLGIVYLIAMLMLMYLGPVTTLRVKNKLKKNPVDVVVSLTTTPYRIESIKPVLDGILRQSIKPTKIYVNVPWKFKRENIVYVIPEWLKNYSKIYPNIIINRTKDYGPATKLLATLEKEHDPKTIIITLDDDFIYPKHIVRDLVKQYLFKFNQVPVPIAITGHGFNLFFLQNSYLMYYPVFLAHNPSLLVTGSSGVAYRREFFKEDIFSLTENLPLSCFLSDDLMISAYLLANGVKIVKSSSFYFNGIMSLANDLDYSYTADSLTMGANNLAQGSNEKNYSNCVAALTKHGKENYVTAINERTSFVFSIAQNNITNLVTKNYFDNYLRGLIRLIPFLPRIIVSTLS